MRTVRVTYPENGEIVPRMYSYWSNAVFIGQSVYVFCGRSDGMPMFFKVDGDTVAPLPTMIPYRGTTEGWYWDVAGRIYLIDGPRLRRVNPLGSEDQVVFDITNTHAGCDLWQPHSSDDGRVHSATVRRIVSDGAYSAVGTVVYRDGQERFFPADSYVLDESALTSDGAYLIIKSSPLDDNLVVNLMTGEQRWLLKRDGALGHSDCGPSFMVGADRDHEPRACVRWNLTRPLTLENRILLTRSPDWSGGDLGHVSVRNGRCIISDGTHIKSVGLNGEGAVNLIEHGMVGSDYDHAVEANLDPTGRVACYMTNNGTDRQDVFLLFLDQTTPQPSITPQPSQPSQPHGVTMKTSVALVTLDAQGNPVKGVIAHLESGVGELLFDITNPDGYSVFKQVDVPFTGVLKLAGTVEYYERPVSLGSAQNVTIRVGGQAVNPGDIVLDPCVPFA